MENPTATQDQAAVFSRLMQAIEDGKVNPSITFNIDKGGSYNLKEFARHYLIGSFEWTAAWYAYMQTGNLLALALPTKYVLGYVFGKMLYAGRQDIHALVMRLMFKK